MYKIVCTLGMGEGKACTYFSKTQPIKTVVNIELKVTWDCDRADLTSGVTAWFHST